MARVKRVSEAEFNRYLGKANDNFERMGSDIKLEPREIPWGEDHLPYTEKQFDKKYAYLENTQDGGLYDGPMICNPGEEYVAPYKREDGTWVQGYCRRMRDY